MTASGDLERSARRLSAQQREQWVAATAPHFFRATITTYTPGAAGDGNALVKVTYQSKEMVVRYPDSYTPAVGRRVLVINLDNQPEIVHHAIGGL